MEKELLLYLTKLNPNSGNGLVVCVEQAPSLLEERELSGLEHSINLLKLRLMHN